MNATRDDDLRGFIGGWTVTLRGRDTPPKP